MAKRPKIDDAMPLVGMIPFASKLDADLRTLSDLGAKDWLRDHAGDYARVVRFGFECEDESDRAAYGMLAVDLSYTLDACAEAVARGAVRVRYDTLNDPRERRDLCKHLARICATRPTHSTGAFVAVYDDLARRILELLAEPQEAA